MTFYDRVDEFETLREAAATDGHSFVVLYGRRRVGKTELLKEFVHDRPHIYHLAAQESETRQREKFVEQTATAFDDRVPRIDSWPEALGYLGEHLTDDPRVVVIDEFPYLIDANDSLPSYMQAFVDEQLTDTDAMLVLCGSSISVMETDVLGHDSPLYGRRTAQIDLQPFTFTEARAAIDYAFADAVRSYSITGGTPMYLMQFDYTMPLAENVHTRMLTPSAVLYNEPEFLLRTELRNPARYLSILEAIALGHTTPNEIAGATGIDQGPLSKYLRTLRQLRLITREIPVTASQQKSKRSLYRIADDFLRFWFRYVEPNRSSIAEAPDIVLEDTILPDLPTHVATTFETVCQEAVWAAIREGTLDRYAHVGRWWHGEDEIDIVGLAPSEDQLLLGECKWTEEPVSHGLVTDLEAKADRVRWGPADREVRYALFSKAGFVDGLADELGEDWTLFSLDELELLLRPQSQPDTLVD